MPIFSIIVVSLNAANLIEETIKSILSQDFSDYEIIVKDGESKDGTVEKVPQSDKIKVFVKKDISVYDAMNQAIEEASGKYLCFMNCGDSFADSSVLKKVREFITSKDEEEALYYGNYITQGHFVQSPALSTAASLFRNPLCHQTMFFPSSLFKNYGMYDTKYKILADYERTLCAFFNNIPFYNTGITVAKYQGGGLSTWVSNKERYKNESREIKRKYFSEKQIRKFKMNRILTLHRLRVWLVSDKAPKCLQKAYHKIANKVKS